MQVVKTMEHLKELYAEKKLNGIVQLSDDLYHKGPGFSRSNLTDLLKSYDYMLFKKAEKKEKTPSLIFGDAVHVSFLTPDIFKRDFLVMPKFGLKKIEKEAKAVWLENHKDFTCLKEDVMDEVKMMAKKLHEHPTVTEVMKTATTEQAIYWTKDEILYKCKIDITVIASDTKAIPIDLKTTIDASPQEFRKSIRNYNYDVQAAHYLEGVRTIWPETDIFAYICIEKTPPFGIGLYNLNDASIEAGEQVRQALIKKLKLSLEHNEKRGYSINFEDISLPAYGFDIDSRTS